MAERVRKNETGIQNKKFKVCRTYSDIDILKMLTGLFVSPQKYQMGTLFVVATI